jgi:acyl carrier protein
MTVQRGVDTSTTRSELATILTHAAGLSPEAIADAGDAPLQDLGLDSLAVMQLQAAVKARYDVEIPDESLQLSIPEINRFVAARLGEHPTFGSQASPSGA